MFVLRSLTSGERLRLFSYVVDHDLGWSPNPTGGYCTLAFCKYRTKQEGRRDVVELAEVGDWVIGTGGKSKQSTQRNGCLLYAMQITEKLTLRDYFRNPRFAVRAGNQYEHRNRTDRFALVSNYFFYFGSSAPTFAPRHLDYPIEKKGRRHRSRFSEPFIDDFVRWLEQHFTPGVHGQPCVESPEPDLMLPAPLIDLGLPSKKRRKTC